VSVGQPHLKLRASTYRQFGCGRASIVRGPDSLGALARPRQVVLLGDLAGESGRGRRTSSDVGLLGQERSPRRRGLVRSFR
jgi:hypothetical protein